MKFSLFKKKKKTTGEEKGHREPIMVRIFNENNGDFQNNVTFTSLVDEDAPEEFAPESDRKKVHFVPNQKYHTISCYVIGVMLVSLILSVVIFNITPVLVWIRHFLAVISPFLAGAILAFVVAPIVNLIDEGLFEKVFHIKKPGLRLTLSIIITYAVMIGLLVLAFIVLIPQVGESVSDLLSKSKLMYDTIYDFVDTLEERFPTIDFTFITDKLADVVPDIISTVTTWLSTSIPKLLSTSYAIFKSLINFLLTIAISIYMVCDKRRIARASTQFAYVLFKPSRASYIIKTSRECGQIFFGFIVGKSIDSLIIGLLCFMVVSIFRLPYPVLISVIVGITNMIPFFGPFIGAIPGILLYLCLDPIYALIFAIIIVVLQQLDGWVIGPMILGDSTGIRPIWVIFGITVGGAYFGVIGMFLGVPFTAVIVYLIDKLIRKTLKKKNIEVS